MRAIPVAFVICLLAAVSLGTVVKRKDGIQMTQTDPVGYQEKLKEEEGGKKGPPAPTIELHPKRRFLIEAPVAKPRPEPEAPADEEFEIVKPETQTDDTLTQSDDFDWEEGEAEGSFLDSEFE